MKKKIFYVCTIILLLVACGRSSNDTFIPNPTDSSNNDGNTNNNNNTSSDDWLIPISEVKDGGPGKDGIPSIDSPRFIDANDSRTDFLSDEDLVIGIVKGDVVRAYPHLILDWHEIVNDNLNGNLITINYCPLTGTAFGWRSISNGQGSKFGVSGLLYNTNLILYDRNTGSNWSQLKLKCVNGGLIGDEPLLENIIETNWGTWSTIS